MVGVVDVEVEVEVEVEVGGKVVTMFSVKLFTGDGVVNVITTGAIVLVVGILKTGGKLGVVGING